MMRSIRLFAMPKATMEQRKEFDQNYQNGYSLATSSGTIAGAGLDVFASEPSAGAMPARPMPGAAMSRAL